MFRNWGKQRVKEEIKNLKEVISVFLSDILFWALWCNSFQYYPNEDVTKFSLYLHLEVTMLSCWHKLSAVKMQSRQDFNLGCSIPRCSTWGAVSAISKCRILTHWSIAPWIVGFLSRKRGGQEALLYKKIMSYWDVMKFQTPHLGQFGSPKSGGFSRSACNCPENVSHDKTFASSEVAFEVKFSNNSVLLWQDTG